MKKTATEIYALLICLAAMACLSINTGFIIYDIVSLFKPDLTISNYQYRNHQNNNNYWRYLSDKSEVTQVGDFSSKPRQANTPTKRPTEDILTKQRLASYQSALEAEERAAVHDLVFEFIIALLSLVLFFVHWRFVLHKKQ